MIYDFFEINNNVLKVWCRLIPMHGFNYYYLLQPREIMTLSTFIWWFTLGVDHKKLI